MAWSRNTSGVVTSLTGNIDFGGTEYAVQILGVGGYFGFNDNKLSLTAPYVDFGGLGFKADNTDFILYSTGNVITLSDPNHDFQSATLSDRIPRRP